MPPATIAPVDWQAVASIAQGQRDRATQQGFAFEIDLELIRQTLEAALGEKFPPSISTVQIAAEAAERIRSGRRRRPQTEASTS